MIKRPRSHTLGDKALREFENLIPDSWIIRRMEPDYGLDREITIVEDEIVTENVIWIQMKARERIKETQKTIYYDIETKYLKYYERCRFPVLIVIWVKTMNAYYYIFAQKHIKESLSVRNRQWRMQKTVRLFFPLKLKIDSFEDVKSIAVSGFLYIIQLQLNIDPEHGGVRYWLDGIPRSDIDEFKKHILKAFRHLLKGNNNLAISEFELILRIYIISPLEKMSVLVNLGSSYLFVNNYEEAKKNYHAVLKLNNKIQDKDALEGELAVFGNLGIIYRHQGDLKNALEYHEKALEMAIASGYEEDEASQLVNIGNIYHTKGNLEKSLDYYLKGLYLDQKNEIIEGVPTTLLNIGVICHEKGEPDNALDYYTEALEISRYLGFMMTESLCLTNIGVLYYDREDFDVALQYYHEALDIDRKTGSRRGEADNLGAIGRISYEREDLDNAMEFHTESLTIHRSIGNKSGEAEELGSIGLIYNKKGEYETALQYHELALEIRREIGNKKGEAFQLHCIGEVYINKNEIKIALEYQERALAMFEKYGIMYGRDEIEKAICTIKEKGIDN